MSENNKKKDEQQPAANVAFVVRDGDGKVLTDKALEIIQTAKGAINLPKREDQAKPFFHEDADMITAAFPFLYKPFTGEKKAK